MNRKQKRKLKQHVKIAAVSGALMYLSVSVLAFDRDSAEEKLYKSGGGSISIHEATRTIELARMAGEALAPETERLLSTMFQDLGVEQIDGFKEYHIPEKYAMEGGCFPLEVQRYTYVVCGNYDVDYTLVLAMIEVASAYCNDAVSECGAVGYMQVIEKWHKDRMERLNVDDLSNPYFNIIVGVDYMAELLERYPEEVAVGYYNMGYKAVEFWNNGKIITSYAEKVLSRRMKIFMEDMAE